MKILKGKEHVRKVDIIFFQQGISYTEIQFHRVQWNHGDTEGNGRHKD